MVDEDAARDGIEEAGLGSEGAGDWRKADAEPLEVPEERGCLVRVIGSGLPFDSEVGAGLRLEASFVAFFAAFSRRSRSQFGFFCEKQKKWNPIALSMGRRSGVQHGSQQGRKWSRQLEENTNTVRNISRVITTRIRASNTIR